MTNSRKLFAGAARADITPEDLTGLNPMGESFSAVHDPIFVRALVVADGRTSCAVIAADLIEVGDTTGIRDRIATELGIPAGHVLIAPSHSHNAPRIGLVPPGGKARTPSPESLAYTETVYDVMIDAVRRAGSTMEPVSVGIARETVDVNVNREQYSGGRWILGYNPDGPSDKTLTVITFTAETGQAVAVLMNYAVHSTVALGIPELSGDLAGVAAAHVEGEIDGAVAVWTSGALGDQAPRVSLFEPTANSDRDRSFAYDAAQAQGFLVGATAVRAVAAARRHPGPAVVSGGELVVPCPVRKLDVPPGMEQADVDTVDLTLSCLTIGGIALTGVGGEVTVPVYRALTAISPLATTLIVSNANARIGYLPDDEAFDRDTPAAQGCPIVPGYAHSAIVDGLVKLISASEEV